eukprot:11177852-Lingulodinium_polyedra.AAC.1
MSVNVPVANLIESARQDALKLSEAWQAVLRKGGSKLLAHLAYRALPREVDGVVVRGTWPPLIASLRADAVRGGR